MRDAPRLFSIPPGAPFLPTLAEALLDGRLVEGFDRADPLALAATTIYLPTRRAARELRSVFVGLAGGGSAILPTIRALGEFDEEAALFDGGGDALSLPPPIGSLDRLLLLAELVRAWKRRLPAHLMLRYQEEVVVPASAADALWHARDLATLMDEVETENADWAKLAGLVDGDLAGWWQIILDFLDIVIQQWPKVLQERNRLNPASYRAGLIRLEAERLARSTLAGPVIAAGSTGSIPATRALLETIARLDRGAVVLPGLDLSMDGRSWAALNETEPEPAVFGHPQYGLAKLLRAFRAARSDVAEIGPMSVALSMRRRTVADAMRPAATTDAWRAAKAATGGHDKTGGAPVPDTHAAASCADALDGVTLVDAPNERSEAAAIAIALKQAAQSPDARVALVTPDRNLARRVSAELLRLGVSADDSGGTPLARIPPAELLRLAVEAVATPGDPMSILSLLKSPLLTLGTDRPVVRHAAETIELVALRGGTGRPDILQLPALLETRLAALAQAARRPFWAERLSETRIAEARSVAQRLASALRPLEILRHAQHMTVAAFAHATVEAFEALGERTGAGPSKLYEGDGGERLAGFLRDLVGSEAPFALPPSEWPDVLAALMASEVVKPRPGAESRIAIWGALEARLQSVDMLVIGGLNEGVWPANAGADRFMSRFMKTGMELEPPERRIGLAAHDFTMAMGAARVVLTRSARSGDAPAVASRWWQRLLTYVGDEAAKPARRRGDILLQWAEMLDAGAKKPFAPRPEPTPPLDARPKRFSVTEIETLRRDPYAIYARRILGLNPLDPLLADPGAADRGTLFHEILHRFTESGVNARSTNAIDTLVACGRRAFDNLALPPDIHAVWWPRFLRMAPEILEWEAGRAINVRSRHPEASAEPLTVGLTGIVLSGRADRIDLLAGGSADILDYKTGATPSKAQAHTLLAPQLALEGALLARGAFRDMGKPALADLAFVRLQPKGNVREESILQYKKQVRSASELADDAWWRLEKLLHRYNEPDTGYISRALPFRESEVSGDYDHLARALEWSDGEDEGDGA